MTAAKLNRHPLALYIVASDDVIHADGDLSRAGLWRADVKVGEKFCFPDEPGIEWLAMEESNIFKLLGDGTDFFQVNDRGQVCRCGNIKLK